MQFTHDDFSAKKLVWNEKFEREGGWSDVPITFLELEKAGYDQMPAPGNYWGGTTTEEIKKVTDGIREFAAVKRLYYP